VNAFCKLALINGGDGYIDRHPINNGDGRTRRMGTCGALRSIDVDADLEVALTPCTRYRTGRTGE
jgi:hypothetical protein